MRCPLCKKEAEPLLSIPDYPVFANALEGAFGEDELYLFEVYFCEACVFGFQATPPEAEKIYTRARAPSGVSKIWRDHYEAFARFATNGLEKRGAAVLDVGAGHGFLSEQMMARGFQVEALDLNPGEKLKSLGIPVYTQFFGKGFPLEKKYDVVLLSHVAEHVNDLERFLEEAVWALKPSGRLVFSVPDWVGGMQKNDLSLFIPEHTWYFSERSLKKILGPFGFVLEAVADYNAHSLFVCARKEAKDDAWKERPLLGEVHPLCKKYAAGYRQSLQRVTEILKKGPDPSNGRAVFFGAHSMTLHLVVPIKPWARFQRRFALIDNDPHKHGLRLSGTPWRVFRPEEIGLKKSDTVIIPQSSYAPEMAEQVERLGAPYAVI